MTGIIICSRTNSRRIPNKPFRFINGRPIIEHLISRLLKSKLPICLAVPLEDCTKYQYLKDKFPGLTLFYGWSDDPLRRMSEAAKMCGFENIVRVTHDKILVDPNSVVRAVKVHINHGNDYSFSQDLTDGSSFEIVKSKIVTEAANRYKDQEHLSYAFKVVSQKTGMFTVFDNLKSPYRFLIDYEEDIRLMETIFSTYGNDISLSEAIEVMKEKPWYMYINRPPSVSLYTCTYNCAPYLKECIQSVKEEMDFEHIIIDDCSTDKTLDVLSEFPGIKWFKNDTNIGLASSCNVALSHCRGKYIVRLDADDYFTEIGAVEDLLYAIIDQKKDVIYPKHYDGTKAIVRGGGINHHVGGAIFNARALNTIKFTNKLRSFESRDLYTRAKDLLDIGYLDKPLFFYRFREGSMSWKNGHR